MSQTVEPRSTEAPDPNRWRLETPGVEGWTRTARPDAADKYFMVSSDTHVSEPADLWKTRIEKRYRDRLPGTILGADGAKFQKTEGFRPIRLRNLSFEGEDRERLSAGHTPEQRLADHARDGIDIEVMFPNRGLTIWATPDAEFSQAMCRVYNDWAWETYGPYSDRMLPMACLAAADIDGAIAEIQRSAKRGFRGLALPCKPVWGPHDHEHLNYNLPEFDPLWAAAQDADLPVTFHVSTGRDPRSSRGHGGAIVNYTVHSLAPTMEPVANLCGSGVLDRFPRLRFATIEAGIGWVAWTLAAMDEAYKKHHMFVRPKLELLPSEYFKRQGFASFQEDPPGLASAREFGLVGSFLWANDYPHHEGTWPHSAQAIERTMGHLSDGERAQILGLNAARLWNLEIPERYTNHADTASAARKISA